MAWQHIAPGYWLNHVPSPLLLHQTFAQIGKRQYLNVFLILVAAWDSVVATIARASTVNDLLAWSLLTVADIYHSLQVSLLSQ